MINIPLTNSWTQIFGFGVFHSGVEIEGENIEYYFGYIEYGSGISNCLPGQANPEVYIFRKRIFIGKSKMNFKNIQQVIKTFERSPQYHGMEYELLENNCNHFTDHFCRTVCGKRIPGWVNRAAKTADIYTNAWEK
jgi:hypothetical protein